MLHFLILIALLIGAIVFCTLSFERSMWLSIDYWSDKQYRLWKSICAIIGICFLVAIVIICIFSSERFSDQMMKQSAVLVIVAYFSMGTFSQIIHLVAWKKKRDILIENIRMFLLNKDLNADKEKLLENYLFENPTHSKKTIKKLFDKVILEFNNKQI